MKTAEQNDALDAPSADAMLINGTGSQRDPRPKFGGDRHDATRESQRADLSATPEQIAAAIKAEGARLRALDQALFVSTVKYLMSAVSSADREAINQSLRPFGLAKGDFAVPDDFDTSPLGEEWDAYTA